MLFVYPLTLILEPLLPLHNSHQPLLVSALLVLCAPTHRSLALHEVDEAFWRRAEPLRDGGLNAHVVLGGGTFLRRGRREGRNISQTTRFIRRFHLAAAAATCVVEMVRCTPSSALQAVSVLESGLQSRDDFFNIRIRICSFLRTAQRFLLPGDINGRRRNSSMLCRGRALER